MNWKPETALEYEQVSISEPRFFFKEPGQKLRQDRFLLVSLKSSVYLRFAVSCTMIEKSTRLAAGSGAVYEYKERVPTLSLVFWLRTVSWRTGLP